MDGAFALTLAKNITLMSNTTYWFLLLWFILSTPPAVGQTPPPAGTYQDLVTLFHEWRAFEAPPLRAGAPDYTAETFEKRW